MDYVTINSSEYRVQESSERVSIVLSRRGDMLNDLVVPFRAHTLSGVDNPALRK